MVFGARAIGGMSLSSVFDICFNCNLVFLFFGLVFSGNKKGKKELLLGEKQKIFPGFAKQTALVSFG